MGRGAERAALGGAIHAPVLRHPRRKRRRRLLGPLGIGVLVAIGIGAIVAGNSASPPPTAGAVAAETHIVDSPSPSPRGTTDAAPAVVADPAGPPPAAAAAEADLTGYRWPIAHPRITLPFGPSPWGEWFVDGQRFHDGIDLATFCGDRIVAAHDGTVLAAGRHFDDFLGWIGDLEPYYTRLDAKKLWTTLPIVVVIDDGNGYRSLYAHFGKITVKTGPDGPRGRPARVRGTDRARHRLPPPLRPVQPLRDRHVHDGPGDREADEGADRGDRPDRPGERLPASPEAGPESHTQADPVAPLIAATDRITRLRPISAPGRAQRRR